MRILVLIHEFLPIGGGGGRVAQDIAGGLSQKGHEVTILTAHLKGLPKEEILDGGIRLIRVPSLRREAFRASFLSMAAYLFSGFWAGIRLINQNRPDIIHVHFAVPAGGLAWALSRLKKIPYLLTAHLGDVPGGDLRSCHGPMTRRHWPRRRSPNRCCHLWAERCPSPSPHRGCRRT